MASVNNVLSKVVNKLGLEHRLKEHAFLSLWSVVAGDRFAAKSRPLFLDNEGNIVIAVKDASVGQELSLMKTDLLQKLRAFARGLNINVRGMRFDLKHFHNKEIELPSFGGSKINRPSYPNAEELANISLNDNDIALYNELKDGLQPHTPMDMQKRMLSMFESELKLKHWRRGMGFPPCPVCGEPSESLHGRQVICRDCYFASMSTARDI
jgi:predicted nucleic acid-binding Zn ribbon protein